MTDWLDEVKARLDRHVQKFGAGSMEADMGRLVAEVERLREALVEERAKRLYQTGQSAYPLVEPLAREQLKKDGTL